MARIFGEKATGTNGELSHDEFTGLIHRKSGGRADWGNCSSCATHIEDMNTTADQGGITTKYAGRSVFHISIGKRSGKDGCSVFFTLSGDNGPTLTAGIVAVGWHVKGCDHVYDVDWGVGPPFFTGNKLDTKVQHQRGNKPSE